MRRTPDPWQGFEQLEPRQLLAAISWDGGGGDSDWHNPLNWSGDVLPGPADDVLINVPGANIITHIGGSTSVRSLTSAEPLAFSGGATIAVETLWRQIGHLLLNDSTVTGPGDLLLNADASFENATIAGTGNAILWHQRTAIIDGDLTLSRTMTNVGTIRWQAGTITLDSTLTSLPGALFQITLGAQMEGPGTFVNAGKVTKLATWSSPTTIAVTFSNRAAFDVSAWPYWPDALGTPNAGVVEVLGGTLSFTGNVLEKQGSVLRSGHWWVNTITEATLILPGPGIETVPYFDPENRLVSIVLQGQGSSFPQLSSATHIALLVLERGAAFPTAVPTRVDRLTVNNPGVTHAPTLSSVGALSLPQGRLIVGDFHVDEAVIGTGAELTVTGLMQMHNAAGPGVFVIESLTGPGTLRITGTLQMRSGTIAVGSMIIGPTGTLEFLPHHPTRQSGGHISSRLINHGTIDVQTERTWRVTSEIVNRGIVNLRASTAFEPPQGVPAAAIFHNFGDFNILDLSLVTFRGAGGGVRFLNYRDVDIDAGTLRIFGGGGGGGDWTTAAGSELTFGGLDASLNSAFITGAGNLRIGAGLRFESGGVTGNGAMFIGPAARLTIAGGQPVIFGENNLFMRSSITNHGHIIIADHGRANFSSAFANHGTLTLGGRLSMGTYTSFDTSTLRVRSLDQFESGLLTAFLGAQFAGTFFADFLWDAPVNHFFDAFQSDAFSTTVDFDQVLATGLPPGRSVALFTPSGPVELTGRIMVV